MSGTEHDQEIVKLMEAALTHVAVDVTGDVREPAEFASTADDVAVTLSLKDSQRFQRKHVTSDEFKVTLLDAMVGVTECAVLFAYASAAWVDLTSRVVAAIFLGVLGVVPAWFLAVRFCNRTRRFASDDRLIVHGLSFAAVAGALFTGGLIFLLIYWLHQRAGQADRPTRATQDAFKVTLLDAMVGLTECAVLFAFASAEWVDLTSRVVAAVFLGVLGLVPAWFLAVHFCNRTRRFASGDRLIAHGLSFAAVAGALFTGGLIFLPIYWLRRKGGHRVGGS